MSTPGYPCLLVSRDDRLLASSCSSPSPAQTASQPPPIGLGPKGPEQTLICLLESPHPPFLAAFRRPSSTCLPSALQPRNSLVTMRTTPLYIIEPPMFRPYLHW